MEEDEVDHGHVDQQRNIIGDSQDPLELTSYSRIPEVLLDMSIDSYYHQSMVDATPNQTNISQTFDDKIMLEDTRNEMPEDWGMQREQTFRT